VKLPLFALRSSRHDKNIEGEFMDYFRSGSVVLPAVLALAGLGTFPISSRAQAAPAQRQLTVEKIYGDPGLNGRPARALEWSPDGKQVAYLFSVGLGMDAKTELRVMATGTGEAHVLITAEQLKTLLPPTQSAAKQSTGAGRRPPAPFQFAPDGNGLLFQTQNSLTWFDLKTKSTHSLNAGKQAIWDAKISPDGRTVSFIFDHNIWVSDVATGAARPLTKGGTEALRKGDFDWVYPEELEIKSGHWWAPDSSSIAYLEMDVSAVTQYPIQDDPADPRATFVQRYARTGEPNAVARLLVAPLDGSEPRAMDIGKEKEDLIARVQWPPDGKRLAIQRFNRMQNRLDLLIADAATGQSRTVLTETDPAWVNFSDILYFFKDSSRFIWSSERSGFRHIYLYKIDGTEIGQITRGNWEVTALDAVDETRGLVYFTATEKGPLERQIYRIALDGSGLTQISHGDGTHAARFTPGAEVFVDTFSNTATPPRQDLLRPDGAKVATLDKNAMPELANYALSPVEFFTVKARDGETLYASMVKPANFDASRKYPVIVHTYGGPAPVVRNVWGGTSFLFHQMLAERGFIIFSVDNRGARGRGHAFETKIYRHVGVLELSDQQDGVAYLRSLPYVDGARIGIWGWSYGGHMVLHAMFQAPQDFKVGFAGAPVSDWLQYDSIATERFLGLPKDNPEGYREASPVNYAGGLQGKLLIAQGVGDDNVHFINTLLVVNAAIKEKKYIEVAMFPGRGHPVSDSAARIVLMNRVATFFQDNL
jgi:dipeptidyl-peptidase 4